jgi:DNA-binding transcriptional MerR regulator
MYRTQQFAKLAGVTVRTLHHYDRLGLLKPAQRTESGYRLYRTEDLAQLERIVVLRFLGLSLRQIADLLPAMLRDGEGLAETLNAQAIILRDRRDGINRVLHAVESASRSLDAKQTPDWDLFRTILQEVKMQNQADWSKKYYNDAAQQSIEQHQHEWDPEMQARVTAEWNTMFADVEAAIARNVEPASPEGKALAARWLKLVEGFTHGNPDVSKGLGAMYADRENWPETQKQQVPFKPELMAFIRKSQAV